MPETPSPFFQDVSLTETTPETYPGLSLLITAIHFCGYGTSHHKLNTKREQNKWL